MALPALKKNTEIYNPFKKKEQKPFGYEVIRDGQGYSVKEPQKGDVIIKELSPPGRSSGGRSNKLPSVFNQPTTDFNKIVEQQKATQQAQQEKNLREYERQKALEKQQKALQEQLLKKINIPPQTITLTPPLMSVSKQAEREQQFRNTKVFVSSDIGSSRSGGVTIYTDKRGNTIGKTSIPNITVPKGINTRARYKLEDGKIITGYKYVSDVVKESMAYEKEVEINKGWVLKKKVMKIKNGIPIIEYQWENTITKETQKPTEAEIKGAKIDKAWVLEGKQIDTAKDSLGRSIPIIDYKWKNKITGETQKPTEAEIKEIARGTVEPGMPKFAKETISHKLKIDPLIDKLTKIKESTPTFRMDTSKEDVRKYLLNEIEKGSTFQEAKVDLLWDTLANQASQIALGVLSAGKDLVNLPQTAVLLASGIPSLIKKVPSKSIQFIKDPIGTTTSTFTALRRIASSAGDTFSDYVYLSPTEAATRIGTEIYIFWGTSQAIKGLSKANFTKNLISQLKKAPSLINKTVTLRTINGGIIQVNVVRKIAASKVYRAVTKYLNSFKKAEKLLKSPQFKKLLDKLDDLSYKKIISFEKKYNKKLTPIQRDTLIVKIRNKFTNEIITGLKKSALEKGNFAFKPFSAYKVDSSLSKIIENAIKKGSNIIKKIKMKILNTEIRIKASKANMKLAKELAYSRRVQELRSQIAKALKPKLKNMSESYLRSKDFRTFYNKFIRKTEMAIAKKVEQEINLIDFTRKTTTIGKELKIISSKIKSFINKYVTQNWTKLKGVPSKLSKIPSKIKMKIFGKTKKINWDAKMQADIISNKLNNYEMIKRLNKATFDYLKKADQLYLLKNKDFLKAYKKLQKAYLDFGSKKTAKILNNYGGKIKLNELQKKIADGFKYLDKSYFEKNLKILVKKSKKVKPFKIKKTKAFKTLADIEKKYSSKVPKGYKAVDNGRGQQMLVKVKTKMKQPKLKIKFKVKSAGLKTKIKPKMRTATLLAGASITTPKIAGLKTKTKTKTKQKIKTVSSIKSASKIKALQPMKMKSYSKLKDKSLSKTKSKTDILSRTDTRSKTRTKTIQKQIKEKKKPFMFVLPEKKVLSKKESKQFGYIVYAKPVKGKKFVKVNNIPLTKNKALDLRNYITDTSLSRTAMIKKVKQSPKETRMKVPIGYASRTSSKFRDYQIKNKKKLFLKNRRVIEKNKHILDTVGEKKGISLARRIKQLGLKKQPKRKTTPRIKTARRTPVITRKITTKRKTTPRIKTARRTPVITRKITTKRKITTAQRKILLERLKKARAVRMRNLKRK